MKSALLYTRVSTDEQAFGFSLLDQSKRLTEYCTKNNLSIIGSFSDDYSGKTFERPGFNSLLQFLKTQKSDFVLFTKWSRFSRNTADSYQMIKRLTSSGVQVQAIDEPVDFSVAQNKAMLALYLVMPEIDNDMRSDNTQRGMRRAMKEGRYVSTAPQGYLNKRDEKNRPILAIDEFKAPLVKEMFDLVASGNYPQQHVRQMMYKKGLRFCRTKFKTALQNYIYIGKLKIPSFKGEPEEIVQGIHPPLIDESTFYRVQDILSGKRPRKPTRINESLPLRGFLYCTHDHKMTGSCSHGHGGDYYYYHCSTNCQRHRADHANEGYIQLLESLRIKDQALAKIYLHTLESFNKADPKKTSALQRQIEAQQQRIELLHDKYIDGLISPEDYKQIKTRYESNLYELKQQLAGIILAEKEFSESYGSALSFFERLPEYYREADINLKREIIGSITPGKIYFEKNRVRTSELSPTLVTITSLSNTKHIQKDNPILQCTPWQPVEYRSSNLFVIEPSFQDIKVLSNLYKKLVA